MDSLETKIAKDMLKPASTIVEALLGPKIEKVRQWSKDRELSSYLKEEKLSVLIESYLERIIKKSSVLSTIVFPHEKVPLITVYEPIELDKKGVFHSLSESYSIDINSPGQSYLIIDDAGMGKSTFAKNLCLKVVHDTELVPILYELSEYDVGESLIENLAKDFDDIDSLFNRKLFRKLLRQGRFFVILDGFDEVSREAQDTLRSELKEFGEKKGDVSLVITSRPQERLPSILGSMSLKLKTLNKEQAVSILNRYDLYSGLNIGKKLEKEIEKIPHKFLDTPLLVGLLYRTYGFNQSIAEKITIFYGEIYDALYKGHDLTKSGYVREKTCCLDIDEFRQVFRSLSFLYVAKSTEGKYTFDSFVSLIDEAQNLCSIERVSSRSILNDLLLAVPLLTRDGNTLKYMHRSIAEYFAAEYISNAGNKSSLLEKIISSPSREKFRDTIEYLYEISPNLYRSVISMPIAKRYINEYEEAEIDRLYATMSFMNNWSISYWQFDKVSSLGENGRQDLNIPNSKEHGRSSSAFMYGDVNGVKYVATCASSVLPDNLIPDGAWMDLSEVILGDVNQIDYGRIHNDENLLDLYNKFDEGKWYNCSSEELHRNSKLRVIQELMGRQNMRHVRQLNDPRNSTRIITAEKCKVLIEAVLRVSDAESSVTDLLQME